jgi:hypothetical protein
MNFDTGPRCITQKFLFGTNLKEFISKQKRGDSLMKTGCDKNDFKKEEKAVP